MADEPRKLTRLEQTRLLLNGNAEDLSGVNIPDVTSLVDAINRVLAGSGASIDDGTISTITTWSSFKTELRIVSALADLVDSSPATLDTLNELAAALGDDPNFATTMTNMIALKAPMLNAVFTGTFTIPDASLSIAKVSGLAAAIPVKASTAEVTTGTNDTKFVTPLGLSSEIQRLEDLIASYHP